MAIAAAHVGRKPQIYHPTFMSVLLFLVSGPAEKECRSKKNTRCRNREDNPADGGVGIGVSSWSNKPTRTFGTASDNASQRLPPLQMHPLYDCSEDIWNDWHVDLEGHAPGIGGRVRGENRFCAATHQRQCRVGPAVPPRPRHRVQYHGRVHLVVHAAAAVHRPGLQG